VTLGVVREGGGNQQRHLDRLELQVLVVQIEQQGHLIELSPGDLVVGIESTNDLDEARIGGPGEIVDILLSKGVGNHPIATIQALGLAAAGTNHEPFGNCDLHLVVAEVSEELRVGVKLVRVPARHRGATFTNLLEHPYLRKPLGSDEVLFPHS